MFRRLGRHVRLRPHAPSKMESLLDITPTQTKSDG